MEKRDERPIFPGEVRAFVFLGGQISVLRGRVYDEEGLFGGESLVEVYTDHVDASMGERESELVANGKYGWHVFAQRHLNESCRAGEWDGDVGSIHVQKLHPHVDGHPSVLTLHLDLEVEP